MDEHNVGITVLSSPDLYSAAWRHFGSWENAIKAAGLSNNNPQKEPVENNIRKFREELKMTQTELGQKLGVSRPVISSLERLLFEPKVSFALRIAQALGKTVEEVFYLPPKN